MIVDQKWNYVKFKLVRTLLRITHLAHRKSYLVIICPNSHEKLTKSGPDIYQHSCQGSNLNSQNWSILWPWPAVMEGWRSKWCICCKSTFFTPSNFTKSKYIVTLTCSHGGAKVKIKYMLHIYIVPSVDWHQHWRIWSSSFGVEANTSYYPPKI